MMKPSVRPSRTDTSLGERSLRRRAAARASRTPILALLTVLGIALYVQAGLSAANAAHPDCRGERATIVGTKGPDRLHGTPGKDVIVGLGGDDVITGAGGQDTICGGTGDDDLDGGAGRDELAGDTGNDMLDTGGGDKDYVFGGPGKDAISLHARSSSAFAGGGDDTVKSHAKNTRLDGGPGNDHLVGGPGEDIIDAAEGNDKADGGPGEDKITGGAGKDRLDGQEDRDTIYGNGGNDKITTGSGVKDAAYGGGGDDTITIQADQGIATGDAGNDTLTSSSARSLLVGHDGNDTIVGGPGVDEAHGSAGDDHITGGAGKDRLFGEAGNDTIDGGADRDEVKGDEGADTLTSGPGSNDFVLGGPDNDVITLEAPGAAGLGEDGDDNIMSKVNGALLSGGAGNDLLTGGALADTLHGGDGNDTMHGDEGADTCRGDSGTDYCHGGAPGPEDNTPDDVDVCDDSVETKVSCKEGGAPNEFFVTLTGRDLYTPWTVPAGSHRTEGNWSMTFTLARKAGTVGTDVYYDVKGGSGSYAIDGHNYECTFQERASFTMSSSMAMLRLVTENNTYDLSVNNLEPALPTVWRCPNGDFEHLAPVDLAGYVTGRSYDPDTFAITGTEEKRPSDEKTDTWSWTLSPR